MPKNWNAYEWTPQRQKRLWGLLRNEGLTQREAAQAMGISPGTVSRFLNSQPAKETSR